MRPIAHDAVGSAGSGYPRLAAEASAEVAGKLVEVVRAQHAEGLTEAQLRQVREQVAAHLAAAERLHGFPLRNDQEPIFVVGGPSGVA
jgi:cytochrome c553